MTPSRNRRSQVSVSHLLNFSLPPRDSAGHRQYNHASSYRQASYRGDKSRYVNANYRFVVHPSGSYKQQALDPDISIPWHLILQILASEQTQSCSCPICLTDSPAAARMGRCGHIFCLPCLMRMIESPSEPPVDPDTGKPAKKRNSCPLCFESLSLSDAKPVRWMKSPCDESGTPEVGKDVILRLVMRKPGSILALPRDGGERPLDMDEIPWHFAAEVSDYARIMKGTAQYMNEEYEREIRELEFMEQEDEAIFGDGSEWTHKAIERIVDALEVIQDIGDGSARNENTRIMDRSRRQRKKSQSQDTLENSESAPEHYMLGRENFTFNSATSSSSSQSMTRQTSLSSRSPSTSYQPSGHSDAPYYFYQPRDASTCFLSPLDIKILKTAFGAFAAFPSTVLVRVERIIADQVVDEDTRKRVKYLSHLPSGSPMSLLECDWTDVVKPDVLEQFRVDLDKRRKQWKDKESKEERARQRVQREEEERSRSTKAVPLPHESRREHDLSSYYLQTGAEELLGIRGSHESKVNDDLHRESMGWPSLSPSSPSILQVGSPVESGTRTVWGTPAISFSRVGDALGIDDDANHEDSGEDGGWADSWDDVTGGLIYDRILEESRGTRAETGSSGKKKKTKKVVLMSTGGHRGA